MDSAMVIEIARQTLWVTILVCAPTLGAALAVGLLVGIIQAATSINEMTLSFIPKLIAMAIAIVLTGSWQLNTIMDFTRSIFQRIPALFS
jgi:flagellar biosynthesis protein FliQ